MITLDKAHEEINGRFEETIPQEGDIVWYPDEEYGYRFIYNYSSGIGLNGKGSPFVISIVSLLIV